MRAVLNVVKKMSDHIEDCKAKLILYQGLMSAIVPELNGLPRNQNVRNRVEKLAVTITDLDAEIMELTAILISCRIELCEWLFDKISIDDAARVLFYRYGLLKRFSEIAIDLHFSESAVFRLHKIGLRLLGVSPSLADEILLDRIS